MIFDAGLHIVKPEPVVQAFAQLGFPIEHSVALGVIALACVAIYLVPRTAIIGAVLLTGYLGGAVAIQLRVTTDAFPLIFPVIIGGMFWGGLMLRSRSR